MGEINSVAAIRAAGGMGASIAVHVADFADTGINLTPLEAI